MSSSPQERVSQNHRRSDYQRFPVHAVLLVAICEVAGMAAVVHGYQIGKTTLSDDSEFAWFWIGMILIELPLIGFVARGSTSRAVRLALLTLFALVTYAPKLLRNPSSPVYSDEFAHWRAAEEIIKTGALFHPNPLITIISRYPGLGSATAVMVNATGLTIWQAAIVLLIIFHVALVLGIAAIAESIGLSDRTSSIAAIVYSLNSSFLYFDTEYAYESMAIALLVWTLVAYIRTIRSQPGQGRASWGGLTVVLAAATIITHHLSSIALLLTMSFIAIALSVSGFAREDDWRRTAGVAWLLTLTSTVMLCLWIFLVAPGTVAYLSPYFGGGLSELLKFLGSSGGSRQLFTASLSPAWEQKSAYLSTIIALIMALGGVLLIRGQIRNKKLPSGRQRALTFAFALSGLVYFPSTVFILFPFSAEGARRSWAFTWIGLCILIAPAAIWLLDWVRARKHQWQRVIMRSGLGGVFAVALVGGTAAGLDASYRFPGPFLYGSDARAVTPELIAMDAWFAARFGTGNNIIAERDIGLILGSFGLQNPSEPSSGFPVWNLYLEKPGAPIEPPYLLSELSASNYSFLIVDQRMAYELPEVGVTFANGEPSSMHILHRGKTVFYGNLSKFNDESWMIKVYQSDNYSIYRLELPVGTKGYSQVRLPTSKGKLSVSP